MQHDSSNPINKTLDKSDFSCQRFFLDFKRFKIVLVRSRLLLFIIYLQLTLIIHDNLSINYFYFQS